MRTPLFYGLGVAFVTSVIALTSHILGYTTDPEKFMVGMVVGGLVSVVALIIGIVLGTRKVRAERGPAGLTYGQAFKAGWLVAAGAAFGSAVFSFIYMKFLHPNFADTQVEWMRSFMERMHMPPDKMEKALEDMRAKATVGRQVINSFLFNLIFGAVISLVTAAILKRQPADAPPELPPGVS